MVKSTATIKEEERELEEKLIQVNTIGSQSSSYQVQQSAKIWGNIGLVLGVVVAIGPQILPILPENSKYAIIAGSIVSAASLLYKGLVDRGFIHGATTRKVAEMALVQGTPISPNSVTVNQKS
jgi:hypothetical protein